MAKTFREWDPAQAWLLPPSVKELVPEGHLAHFVRDTVRQEVDLEPILTTYSEERGYPPYHPALMTALLLYGYCRGVYSSRAIARACEERVDFMAVTGRETPDFRTIAAFRSRHLGALRGLFVEVVRLCREAGLVSLGHVALDGTKVRANASKHKAMSYERMRQEERRLKTEVQAWLDRAGAADVREDKEHGEDRRGDELPEWVKSKEERRAKIAQARRALEAKAKEEADDEDRPPEPPAPTSQRNFTDPESRILKTSEGFIQGYNAQAAVDAGSQVIVAQEVVAQQSDVERLEPMLEQIRRNTGAMPKELSADRGYFSENNLRALRRRRVRGYIATGRQRHGSPSATGRRLYLGPLAAAMRARLRRGGHRSRYRWRKITAEPVFGQVKAARGFRQFLMRGLEAVRGEWSLIAAAHNLLKLAKARATA
jgi:transposase